MLNAIFFLKKTHYNTAGPYGRLASTSTPDLAAAHGGGGGGFSVAAEGGGGGGGPPQYTAAAAAAAAGGGQRLYQPPGGGGGGGVTLGGSSPDLISRRNLHQGGAPQNLVRKTFRHGSNVPQVSN